jgi:hypothetical protein
MSAKTKNLAPSTTTITKNANRMLTTVCNYPYTKRIVLNDVNVPGLQTGTQKYVPISLQSTDS